MICCLNPDCERPLNQNNSKFCQQCGSELEARLLNRFQVLKVIGQGGFGRTYLALDNQKLDEKCVVKQLVYRSGYSSSSARAESMFYDEARKLQSLGSHKNIPALYAFFIHQERQYIVQELIEGLTIQEESRQGPWTEDQLIAFLKNILPVIDFIHRKGVIHRDIKPANIMRCRHTGELMLIDFGISKSISLQPISKTGTTVGSHGYSSKEQILDGKVTPASDLFSLGVCCFYLLTHQSPIELAINYGFSWVEKWRSHLSTPLSPKLDPILDRLLQVEVQDRYSSASEVLKDLKKTPIDTTSLEPETILLKSDNTSQPKSIAISEPPKTSLQTSNAIPRRKFIQYGSLASLSALGAIALWQWSKKEQPSKLAVTPPNLKGRSQLTSQVDTITIDSAGQIQEPQTLVLDLIREDLGNDIHLDLVNIPAGQFQMGSPASEPSRDDDESPRHSVNLPPFFMGIFEITQKQWRAVAQMPQVNLNLREDLAEFEGSERPVERVTWFEAQEFCQRLSIQTGQVYRLPSEAEWEYACRAGNSQTFSYGNVITSELANFDATGTYRDSQKGEFRKKTTDVGSFYANAWGLFDMHGNVLEWCQDYWHANYDNAPTNGDSWTQDGDDGLRVLRGGSWFDHPRYIRSANRSKKKPLARDADVGFRVVCEI